MNDTKTDMANKATNKRYLWFGQKQGNRTEKAACPWVEFAIVGSSSLV